LKNDASLSSLRSTHDAEVRRLRDQLSESDNIRQQHIEQLQYEHTKQLEELQREVADSREHGESARRKFEREKNSLEAELTKALQDLVTVTIVHSLVEIINFTRVLFLSESSKLNLIGRLNNHSVSQ